MSQYDCRLLKAPLQEKDCTRGAEMPGAWSVGLTIHPKTRPRSDASLVLHNSNTDLSGSSCSASSCHIRMASFIECHLLSFNQSFKSCVRLLNSSIFSHRWIEICCYNFGGCSSSFIFMLLYMVISLCLNSSLTDKDGNTLHN